MDKELKQLNKLYRKTDDESLRKRIGDLIDEFDDDGEEKPKEEKGEEKEAKDEKGEKKEEEASADKKDESQEKKEDPKEEKEEPKEQEQTNDELKSVITSLAEKVEGLEKKLEDTKPFGASRAKGSDERDANGVEWDTVLQNLGQKR